MNAHPASTRTYYVIFAVLLVCTYLTWQIARFNLGIFNVAAALLIATLKAVLVVLFFMHAKDSPRLTWLVAVGGLVWLGILMSLTDADYFTRWWTNALPQ